MEIRLIKGNIEKDQIKKIKSSAKKLLNMNNILTKLNNDGYLNVIKNTFVEVLLFEMEYSYKELLKMKSDKKNFDLGTLLLNNSHIFKENLKNISNFISILKS